MKKSVMVLMVILLIGFSGCENPQSSSGSYFQTSPEISSDMIGESGMTELEIKDIFSEKLDKYAEVWFWIVTCPFLDFDESMPVYPDVDAVNLEGFDWSLLIDTIHAKKCMTILRLFTHKNLWTLDFLFGLVNSPI